MKVAPSATRAERIAAVNFDYASQQTEDVACCNLCGSNLFIVLAHRDRYQYLIKTVGCRRCGLVFLSPRMTPEAYGLFYKGIYRPLVSAFHGRLIDAQTIQSEQRDYAANCGDLLAPFIQDAGFITLLDIGGSTGVVAQSLVGRFNFQATLIDPSPSETAEAKANEIEIISGLVEETDLAQRRFDVITLCQTVDHLLDVAGTLSRVRELITEQGLFFVDIIDFQAAYLKGSSIEGAIKIDHPYYLTQATIEAFLQRSGFRIVKVNYASDNLHIGYVCRPDTRTSVLPAPLVVDKFFDEMNQVQKTQHP